MQFPEDLKYTRDHEWIRVEGNSAVVGITDFAQRELGDIVYVEIEQSDAVFPQDAVFGTVEAVKTVSDLLMPVAGKIVEVNTQLNETPEAVNRDPYGAGWMIRIEISDASGLDTLLSASQYNELIAS